jgi:hypothetical protein
VVASPEPWFRNHGSKRISRRGRYFGPFDKEPVLTGDDDAIERGELSSQPRVADGRVSRDMNRFGCSGGSVFS